ncbi:hypothetical protein [Aeromonas enteropelogenes]|uniref:hypothetical protein n=1 Tax=Aeromonas enteropelogenes TaxID=29489 RepID=UPI003BA18330
MYKGFDVSISEIQKGDFSSKKEYISILEKQKEKIKDSIDKFYFNNGSIDADKLKESWFPFLDNMHVFISHSHQDLPLAEDIACWLYENFKLNSFLDSHVWGYANDLLKALDDKYALSEDKLTYNYSIRNYTTSNVHMMLSSSLCSMIDACECLFFINTNNSISNIDVVGEASDDRTPSPWIMLELMTSSIIRKKEEIERERCIMEGVVITKSEMAMDAALPKFHHKAPLNHLHKLGRDELHYWHILNLCNPMLGKPKPTGFHALSELYNAYGDDKIKL